MNDSVLKNKINFTNFELIGPKECIDYKWQVDKHLSIELFKKYHEHRFKLVCEYKQNNIFRTLCKCSIFCGMFTKVIKQLYFTELLFKLKTVTKKNYTEKKESQGECKIIQMIQF